MDLTGWGSGPSILLPAGPVLSFRLAYILTRSLGANIGDYLSVPKDEVGRGLGTFGTSVLFLATIVVTVAYLTKSRRDRTELIHQRTP